MLAKSQTRRGDATWAMSRIFEDMNSEQSPQYNSLPRIMESPPKIISNGRFLRREK